MLTPSRGSCAKPSTTFGGLIPRIWRRSSGVRVLIWWGIWCAIYGVHPLLYSLDALALLPHWLHVSAPYVGTASSYLLLVVATRAWLELGVGKIRLFAWAGIFVGLAIGLAGFGYFLFTGDSGKFIPYNK